MTILELKETFFKALKDFYSKEEINVLFKMASAHVLCMSAVDLALNPNHLVESTQVAIFQKIIFQLKEQVPIQYIVGSCKFYGLSFEVNKHTLIPRPETEELVDWVLVNTNKNQQLKILDIGTGSGCIAISLAKKLPNATVHAIDFSEEALKIASKNADKHQVSIDFFLKDILSVNSLEDKYDIIVSNPPYVRNAEKKSMKPNVLDYEPATALFVEDHDPLIFYKKITQLAATALNPHGFLFFEINQYLPVEVANLLTTYDFAKVETNKDFLGNFRMVMGRLLL
jgi:release factor glutamine methyltransferase